MFQPPAALVPRIAPTERAPKDGPPLRGVVHDPTARYMGGVAGHAGLFSTADDLARFAQMMLNGGELDGVRLFSPLTVRKFTEPQSPPDQPILRGLGWDIDSPLFRQPRRAVPHRLLRPHRLYRHFHLDRPVHQDLRHPAGQQRAPPAAARADPACAPRWPPSPPRPWASRRAGVTLTGYNETLTARRASRSGAQRRHAHRPRCAGRKELPAASRASVSGLSPTRPAWTAPGRRNVDLMRQAGVQVAALFSPEHGFAGVRGPRR